jgi:hypothetical protein
MVCFITACSVRRYPNNIFESCALVFCKYSVLTELQSYIEKSEHKVIINVRSSAKTYTSYIQILTIDGVGACRF